MTGKRIVKGISSMITTGLCILLMLTLFLVILTKASGGEANLFGYQLKTVLSGSMEPSIKTGSILAMKEVDDPSLFQKGDIITFKTDEAITITHRIMEVQQSGQSYVTKGDANNAADPSPVPADNVIGSYTGLTVPYVGYVLSFANSKEGAALLLVIPGIFLILYAGFTVWRTLHHLDQQETKIKTNIN